MRTCVINFQTTPYVLSITLYYSVPFSTVIYCYYVTVKYRYYVTRGMKNRRSSATVQYGAFVHDLA